MPFIWLYLQQFYDRRTQMWCTQSLDCTFFFFARRWTYSLLNVCLARSLPISHLSFGAFHFVFAVILWFDMSFNGFRMLRNYTNRKVSLFRCGIRFEFSARNFEYVQHAKCIKWLEFVRTHVRTQRTVVSVAAVAVALHSRYTFTMRNTMCFVCCLSVNGKCVLENEEVTFFTFFFLCCDVYLVLDI